MGGILLLIQDHLTVIGIYCCKIVSQLMDLISRHPDPTSHWPNHRPDT